MPLSLTASGRYHGRDQPVALAQRPQAYACESPGNTSGIASGHAYPRQADCEGVALRAMQIFVKPMPGPDRHQLAPSGRVLIDVMPWDTVKDVKAKIQVRMGPLYYQRFDEDWDVPAALQSLYYIDIDGEPVSLQLDHATLRDYRIQHGDTLELRWAGGCDNRPVEREEEEQKAEEESRHEENRSNLMSEMTNKSSRRWRLVLSEMRNMTRR
jgi:hypothetical protein